MRKFLLPIAMLLLALILVACGGAEEVAETPVEEAATEEVVVEEPTEEMAPSIAEIAANDEQFSTLVTALDAAGLVETLSGEGAFTVFAPTNDAFAALPEGMLDSLLADPDGALTDVLLYHVVDGAVPAETVVTLDSADTLLGEPVTIEVTDAGVVLNGEVTVTTTDIEASNGIIHIIDGVLVPPSMAEQPQTIVDIAAADERFSTLVTAVEAAGLVEALSAEGPFTVFAPTNDAFAALPEGALDELLADPEGALTDVLLYHVVDGAVPAETVVTLSEAETLLGEAVTINVTDDGVFLNESVQVVETDIEAANGIIHVIDTVLLPPSMAASDEPNIVEVAMADERFSTLVTAVEAAGLAETLSSEGPFTVFAPTNDAFAALPEGTLDSLLADPEGALTDILLYHVVEGEVPADTVVTLDEATTLLGQPVTITATDEGVFLNDDVQVVVTDVQASNGIIHVIDTVLLPSEAAAPDQNIVEVATADGRFTTLVAAVEAAGLAETLSGEGPFTVFAPVDDAFAGLPEGTLDTLLADPSGQLTDILLYHVVDGEAMAADVVELDAVTTLLGEDVTITVTEDGQVFLNETVQVIITDVEASNGVIHVIDGVLLPPQ
ncbi:MAG: fasciclin domain-containing protein [Candidatus Promineifilaceae bacterium]|nr:fasciclin domain-containing protein [Candidatus Promineifilaceae bacterium]